MKRSYPYTGPGASANQSPSQQGQPAAATQPDYSAYGYGTNSSVMSGAPNALSQEAQQAQWHQQWQQYYAQQAASAGAPTVNRPPQQQQQQGVQSQPFQQYQAGTPAPFYNQQYGQQSVMPPNAAPPMQNPAYGWQQPSQFQPQQQQGYVPPQLNNSMPPQGNFYNQANVGPAAKRPRFAGNNQQPNIARPNPAMPAMNGPMYPPGQNNPQMPIGPQGFPNTGPPNPNWQNGSINGGSNTMRTGPMRGGGGGSAGTPPHLGGPSNMAGPMASGPSGMRAPSIPMSDRRGASSNGRPPRPQGIPNRPGLPAAPLASQNKFNGPVGVNAVTPQGRPGGRNNINGPGSAVNGVRRPIVGLRNGVPSGPSGKGGRFDNGKGKAAAPSPSNGSKSSQNKSSGGFDLHRAPAISSKGSTLADQPVPASAKRTFSDFKINAIEIEPISWQWQSDTVEEDADEEGDGLEDDETMHSINDTDSIDSSVIGSSRKRTLKQAKRKEKVESNKEISRLRICFAASQPPADAPTGPKALQSVEGSTEDAKSAGKKKKKGGKTDKEGSPSNQPEWTAFSRGPPQSSTNRISISYASSKRRLVIDSDVIKTVEVNRGEGTIKIAINVTTAAGFKKKKQLEKRKGEEWVVVKGVLLEARENELDNFGAVSRKSLERAWKQGVEVEATAGSESRAAEESESKGAMVEGQDDDDDDGEEEEEEEEEDSDSDSDGDSDSDSDDEDYKEEEDEDVENNDKISAEAKKRDSTREVIQDYSSLPPLYRLLTQHDGPEDDSIAAGSSELIITVSLAEIPSKQEPKWLKSGNVEEWLSALPGFHSTLASSAHHAWSNKITVCDPDPPPTLQDVLQDWSTKSFVGSHAERLKFLEEHQLYTLAGMTELLSKLIRGDRATPTPSIRDLGDPLKEVLGISQFPQSHLTLSIVAIIKMMESYAVLAGSGKDETEGKLQGVIMCLPTHQIFRACDGLLKEVLEKQRLLAANTMRSSNKVSSGVTSTSSSHRKSLSKDEDAKRSTSEQAPGLVSEGIAADGSIAKDEADKGTTAEVESDVQKDEEIGDLAGKVKVEEENIASNSAAEAEEMPSSHGIKIEEEDMNLSIASEGQDNSVGLSESVEKIDAETEV